MFVVYMFKLQNKYNFTKPSLFYQKLCKLVFRLTHKHIYISFIKRIAPAKSIEDQEAKLFLGSSHSVAHR